MKLLHLFRSNACRLVMWVRRLRSILIGTCCQVLTSVRDLIPCIAAFVGMLLYGLNQRARRNTLRIKANYTVTRGRVKRAGRRLAKMSDVFLNVSICLRSSFCASRVSIYVRLRVLIRGRILRVSGCDGVIINVIHAYVFYCVMYIGLMGLFFIFRVRIFDSFTGMGRITKGVRSWVSARISWSSYI